MTDVSEPIIRLLDVWKLYGGEYVLKEVDLDVYRGDFICIRGRSGVGKTSLLRIISLLSHPTRGRVVFMGRDVTGLGDGERSGIRARYFGIVFQGETLISTLSVYENIELILRLKGVRDNKVVEDLMDILGLSGLRDRYPATLSAGEKQRVAIARALAGEPLILLLDEPFANLDEENERLILDLLRSYNEERNTSVVLTTTELYGGISFPKMYLISDSRLIRE